MIGLASAGCRHQPPLIANSVRNFQSQAEGQKMAVKATSWGAQISVSTSRLGFVQ